MALARSGACPQVVLPYWGVSLSGFSTWVIVIDRGTPVMCSVPCLDVEVSLNECAHSANTPYQTATLPIDTMVDIIASTGILASHGRGWDAVLLRSDLIANHKTGRSLWCNVRTVCRRCSPINVHAVDVRGPLHLSSMVSGSTTALSDSYSGGNLQPIKKERDTLHAKNI
ncbi:hypothetical protein Tco_1032658 [Tanacetum coccineum]|uniref:Uncharacterized protein n=1 Tax=Tanacetum coccineum TaxID=301880 RepID=A0ABQ5GER0_9ASTR